MEMNMINAGHNKNNTAVKFGFVVLHYLALDATVECVESIYQCRDQEDQVEIVIVDNGSPNGTGQLLKTRYKDKPYVHVLLLENNIGFAKGNNEGFQFAKEQLGCSFICMLNNDVLLTQESFVQKCFEIYRQNPCAVIGPMVIRKDDSVQPPDKTIRSRNFYIFYRNILKIELILSRIGIDTVKLTEIVMRILKKKKHSDRCPVNIKYDVPLRNIVLHGCCWIFTPQFTEKFQGINNRTFLYREEELLYVLLKKYHMNTLYAPELKIYHMEDIATDMSVKTPKKKREFIYKNEIASLKILIEEMK